MIVDPFDKGLFLPFSEEQWKARVRYALQRNFPIVAPSDPVDEPACIVGGGPSTEKHLAKLRTLKARGAVVFAVNGAYQWLIERGIIPDIFVFSDASEAAVRHALPARDDVIHMIASQAHFKVFEVLKGKPVLLWHAWCDAMNRNRFPGMHYIVTAGSTVGLSAIVIAKMIGHRKVHCFGMDGCYSGARHHSYADQTQDAVETKTVMLQGRSYLLSRWMVAQARDLHLLKRNSRGAIDLRFHGQGLLSHIWKEAA